MVLTDDNFVSIVGAVEEGRVTFDNIRKVTFFLVSTGAAEIAAILVAVWLQWPLVLLPAQLLWLNLVTNGLQDVALAFEPAEKGVLRRPPRRRGGGVLDRLLWERVAVGRPRHGRRHAAPCSAGSSTTTGSLTKAQTVALTTMVVYQVFQAGNARSESESVLRRSPFSNPFLFVATAAALSASTSPPCTCPPPSTCCASNPSTPRRWLRIVTSPPASWSPWRSTKLSAPALGVASRSLPARIHEPRSDDDELPYASVQDRRPNRRLAGEPASHPVG